MIPDVLPAERYRIGRRFSFGSLIVFAAMHRATEFAGATVANAAFVGEVALERAAELLRDGRIGAQTHMHVFTFRAGKPSAAAYPLDALRDPDAVTPFADAIRPAALGVACLLIDLDALIYAATERAAMIDPDMNQAALEGRLKPIPKDLR